MQDLRAVLQEGQLLVADGATGTILQAMGLSAGVVPELWNVANPDAIRALHRAYLDAGSQVILTNTFGGNQLKLERAGELGGRTQELNRAAAFLAKEEVAGRAYVAGDMGPTGELLAPYGLLSYEEAVEVYAQQAQALAEGGVDLVWIETMSDLNEAQAAVEGVKQATDLPIFCSLSFGRGGRTMMGVTPTQAVQSLWSLGLTAVGGNCGEGVEVMIPVLTEMGATLSELTSALDASASPQSAAPARPALIAKPNAGLPRLENGRTVFDLGPEALAAHVPHFVELGAQVIGGCCGTLPDHIAAIVATLRGLG